MIEFRRKRECARKPYPGGRPAKLVGAKCEADNVRFGWSVPKNLFAGDSPAKSCTKDAAGCRMTGRVGMSEPYKIAHASPRKRTGELAGGDRMRKERDPRRSVEDGMLVESMGLLPLPLLDPCSLSVTTALKIDLRVSKAA